MQFLPMKFPMKDSDEISYIVFFTLPNGCCVKFLTGGAKFTEEVLGVSPRILEL